MHECRVGLVGAGNVARRHARVLAGFDDVRLVGVTDVLPDAAHALAGEYGAEAYADAETLLAAPVDALYICVPPFAHGPPEMAALAAGVPMFVEKPLAVDLPTAVGIDALMAQRRVLTAVGHHWRYLRIVQRARDLLADRPVRLVNGFWLDKVPPPPWWVRQAHSGGPVVEQAAHVLDLARLLAGEVSHVTAYGDGAPPQVDGADVDGADVDGATVAALRFAGGAVGTLGSACVLDWKHCAAVEVVAEGLVLRLGEDELVVREGAREHRFQGDPQAARTAVDRAFIDAVRGLGDDVRVPYAQALGTHRLACAVAESAATGRTITLDGWPQTGGVQTGGVQPVAERAPAGAGCDG